MAFTKYPEETASTGKVSSLPKETRPLLCRILVIIEIKVSNVILVRQQEEFWMKWNSAQAMFTCLT